jgi:hypothetical protein
LIGYTLHKLTPIFSLVLVRVLLSPEPGRLVLALPFPGLEEGLELALLPPLPLVEPPSSDRNPLTRRLK